MQEFVRRLESPAFHWKDVVAPTSQDLEAIGEEYRLHSTSVKDCLEPAHLPKYERIADTNFIILRSWDEDAPRTADTVTGLTRKIALFVSDDYILSIHRKDLSVMTRLRESWTPDLRDVGTGLLADIVNVSLSTYRAPLDSLIRDLERFEQAVFRPRGKKDPDPLPALYHIKRRAWTLKRLIWLHREVLEKMKMRSKGNPHIEDTSDNAGDLLFQAEDLHENVTGLINLHLSLATHRTNEVMRLLTIFSVFFMPLTFIVGVYGMNFEYMPELKLSFGYPATLAGMGVVSLSIWGWFRWKGWLR